jgi:nucleoside-diphosphate-sugar epimerase
MKILVTGGSGFVGRNFVKYFLSQGHSVFNIENYLSGGGSRPSSEWLDLSKGEYFEYNMDCREYFQKYPSESYDLALHLAAVVGGRLTIERNPLAVADDLSIDSEFWKWASKSKPHHIICFSSSAAYPVRLQSRIVRQFLKETDINFETDLGMPDLTYGWAKLTHEYLGLLAVKQYGLNVTTYRPFSGYGEDQSLDYPFPSICVRAIESRNSEQIVVWGTGDQSRDFIHIDDVVAGVVATYQKITDGSALNLCTQRLTTFKELARIACDSVGYRPEVKGNSDFPEGVFSRGGDASLLKSYGFEAKITIEQGVDRAVRFFMNERNLNVN